MKANYSKVLEEYNQLKEMIYERFDYDNASEYMKGCMDTELSKFLTDRLEEEFMESGN